MDLSADSSGCCVLFLLLRLNQWVVPACLVYSLRRQTQQTKRPVVDPNPFASPFGHMGWLYLTFGVAAAATVVVTISHGFL